MKGVVFNLLEEAVTHEHGALVWDRLVHDAGASGTYSSLGSYPDAELGGLVVAAAHALGADTGDVLRWFGQRAIPLLAERYGHFFAAHANAHTFVTSLNEIIHPEVHKLYAGAACPQFHFHDLPDGRLGVGYRSKRQLCRLAQGFIEGSAVHYGQTAHVEHLGCMASGDPVCRLAVRWSA